MNKLGIVAAVVVLALTSIVTLFEVAKGSKPDVTSKISTKELQIIDDAGNVRISLSVTPENSASVILYGTSKTASTMKLSLEANGNATIKLIGAESAVLVQATSSNNEIALRNSNLYGPSVSLNDDASGSTINLRTTPEYSVIALEQGSTKLTSFSITGGLPALHIMNEESVAGCGISANVYDNGNSTIRLNNGPMQNIGFQIDVSPFLSITDGDRHAVFQALH